MRDLHAYVMPLSCWALCCCACPAGCLVCHVACWVLCLPCWVFCLPCWALCLVLLLALLGVLLLCMPCWALCCFACRAPACLLGRSVLCLPCWLAGWHTGRIRKLWVTLPEKPMCWGWVTGDGRVVNRISFCLRWSCWNTTPRLISQSLTPHGSQPSMSRGFTILQYVPGESVTGTGTVIAVEDVVAVAVWWGAMAVMTDDCTDAVMPDKALLIALSIEWSMTAWRSRALSSCKSPVLTGEDVRSKVRAGVEGVRVGVKGVGVGSAMV